MSDVAMLTRAFEDHYARRGSTTGLDGYSQVALSRVWKAVRYSWWMTTVMHRFPDQDGFDRRNQQAELDLLASSEAARRHLAENYVRPADRPRRDRSPARRLTATVRPANVTRTSRAPHRRATPTRQGVVRPLGDLGPGWGVERMQGVEDGRGPRDVRALPMPVWSQRRGSHRFSRGLDPSLFTVSRKRAGSVTTTATAP